jgi:hypothetical protein
VSSSRNLFPTAFLKWITTDTGQTHPISRRYKE